VKALTGAVSVLAIVLAIGCGGDDDSSTEEPSGAAAVPGAKTSDDATGRSKPKVEVPEGEPPTELISKELIEGTGTEVKLGDEVTVQYVGVNYESGEEFDSSWGREPFSFTVGSGMVIPGWEQGVAGMKVGGRRELIIPPDLAYGEEGSPPAIPPNETLVFVIDLYAVK